MLNSLYVFNFMSSYLCPVKIVFKCIQVLKKIHFYIILCLFISFFTLYYVLENTFRIHLRQSVQNFPIQKEFLLNAALTIDFNISSIIMVSSSFSILQQHSSYHPTIHPTIHFHPTRCNSERILFLVVTSNSYHSINCNLFIL